MGGFIFFVFVAFFVIPALSKSAKRKKKPAKQKQWGQSHADILKAVQEQREKHGHSNAKQNTHSRLHANDESNVFPEDHLQRVRARDLRDRKKNQKIEEEIHSRKNRGVIRAGNKGRDDWGVHGETPLLKGSNVLVISAMLVVAYIIINMN